MSTPTIAQKVDTQARVIRSLNLIHCADTQHMVGAVELERLLNLEVENRWLRSTIKELEEITEYLRQKNDKLEYGRTSK